MSDQPNFEATKDFLKRCFKYNDRVIIEDRNIYAWPDYNELRKRGLIRGSSGPPMWDILRSIGDKYAPDKYSVLDVGNGGCCRGDQASYSRLKFLIGVFHRDDFKSWIEKWEELRAWRVQQLILGEIIRENIYCRHGGKKTCEAGCFKDWGVFCHRKALEAEPSRERI